MKCCHELRTCLDALCAQARPTCKAVSVPEDIYSLGLGLDGELG
jgi:hypothetical protein